jgi:aminopeptidase N
MVTSCAIVAAACGAPSSVVVDRADASRSAGPSATTAAPPPATDAPAPSPTDEAADTGGDSGSDATVLDTAPLSTSVGDVLFPELGAASLDVVHYDVELRFGDEVGRLDGDVTLDGVVTLDIQLTEPVAAIALDVLDLAIDDVVVDGVPAEHRVDRHELIVELPEPADADSRIDVRVEFADADPLYSSPAGFDLGWYVGDDGLFVVSEPDGTRTWLPSNDHPADKATWTIELVVPDDVVAIANGELSAGAPTPDGTQRRWVWDAVDPMPTYLVQVIIGDYVLVEAEPYRSSSGDIVRIEHAVPTSSAIDIDVLDAMMRDQLDFYETLLGPYPASSYGLAFLDDGIPGLAMETQGRSQFTADDFVSRETSWFSHAVTAHEMAHHWFGNAVSPERWDDIWLNEGLTTYAEWLWLDHADEVPLESSAESGIRHLGFYARHAGTGPGAPDARSMFTGLTYGGGGAATHALRLLLGDETFFGVLRNWVQDNIGTSRSIDDFVELAVAEARAAAIDADVRQWADRWLFSSAPPTEYP